MESIVEKALLLFIENSDLDEDSMFDVFIKNGIEPAIAEKIMSFVPIAFFRSMMDSTELSFCDYYLLMNQEGEAVGRNSFDSEETYKIGYKLSASIEGRDEYLSIAGRSPELHAVNKALNSGSKLSDLELSPVVITFYDQIDEGKVSSKEKWWKNLFRRPQP